MLRADIKTEQEVAEGYDRAAKEVEDPDLKELLLRIRDHEVYDTEVFSDLLKEKEQQG
jgi:rubrerythrin